MAEYDGWVLTDVLLFTHLVHLPRAYASKPYKYYGLFTFHVGLRITHKVCDHFKYYAMRMLIEITPYTLPLHFTPYTLHYEHTKNLPPRH